MSTEERVARLENAFATLLEMTRNLDERDDTHTGWINELGTAQAETERKIAALVDAQIRTEDAMVRLADAQAHTDKTVAALASKVDALTDLIKARG
jgi:peptidoglycan hydrolase CwlO-like protein